MSFRFCVLAVFSVTLIASCYPLDKQNQTIIATSTHVATSEGIVDAQHYVGTIYPPYPDAVVFQEGSLIYPLNQKLKWSVSRVSDNLYDMLWLSKVVSDTNGPSKHEVSDVIVLPLEEEKRVVAVSTCLLSDVIDPEIVALARWDESVRTTRFLPNQNILLAWKVDQATGKFEELSKQNIECYFE